MEKLSSTKPVPGAKKVGDPPLQRASRALGGKKGEVSVTERIKAEAFEAGETGKKGNRRG